MPRALSMRPCSSRTTMPLGVTCGMQRSDPSTAVSTPAPALSAARPPEHAAIDKHSETRRIRDPPSKDIVTATLAKHARLLSRARDMQKLGAGYKAMRRKHQENVESALIQGHRDRCEGFVAGGGTVDELMASLNN